MRQAHQCELLFRFQIQLLSRVFFFFTFVVKIKISESMFPSGYEFLKKKKK